MQSPQCSQSYHLGLGLISSTVLVLSVASVALAQTQAVMAADPIAGPLTSMAAPLTEVAQGQVSSRIQILTPVVGTVLDVPAATVVVRFPADTEIVLQVNSQSVSTELIGRTETDPSSHLITRTWYGVPLGEGNNTITVLSTSAQPLASVDVAVRGTPISLQLTSRETGIPADGRATAMLRGELLDAAGNRSNWDAVVTLTSSDGQFVGPDYAPDQPGFQVEARQGTFTAKLQSSLTSHLVQLKAVANDLEAFAQVQFETPQRSSIATGIVDLRLGARGTDFHSSFRDFLPLDEDNGYTVDLDASVFTMGNLGEWLFTGAYNSDRPLNEDCRGETALFRQAEGSCEQPYPIYGDESTTEVITPSIDSLYLRLERTSPVPAAGADYLMWGDFNTEELATTSQFFTATSRQLHGFKLNYNLGDLAITGLYANNIEGFQRDAIAPDGTRGIYFLSRRLLIPGSEEIALEREELDRPGTVIDRQRLYRGTDYDIDYDRGSVIFKDPISQTLVGDFGEILVQRIVATYQYESQGADTHLWAGRLQYNLNRTLGQESWVGSSYVSETQGNRRFELAGADAQIALGERSQLIAEIAHSTSDFELSGPIRGTAYRLELDGEVGDWLAGRAYWRSTDPGFTNAATTSFVPGQTRYGGEADLRLSEHTALHASFDHEDNFGTAPRVLTTVSDLLLPGTSPIAGSRVDNSLTTYSLGLSQRLGNSDLQFDWIHRDRTDRLSPGLFNASSDQLRSRLTTRLSSNLTLRAQNELNLSSQSDPIYPSRTVFGADWQVIPGITLGVNQIFYGGDGLNQRNAITTIDLTGERQLGENTTLHGRLSSIQGQQFGGALGIEHGFVLAPGLRLDLGYEHTFNSLYGTTAAGSQFSQPYAVGTGASALTLSSGNTYSLGLSYTDNPDFQASTRLEHRTSSQGSNTVFDLAAVGQLSPALDLLFSYELASAANQTINNLGTTSNLKLGLAYRDPHDDRFNALLRYEHRLNPGTLPTNALFGRSIDTAEQLFSTEAIYAPTWQWEFYAKYAFRTSTTRIGLPADVGGNFSSTNRLHLAQLRATYRFNYSWDLTAEARWLGGLGSYHETGYALELGYYATPDLRLYTGYSGGGAQDHDFGVNRSASGFYLGISAKINSLFDGFGLQDIAPLQEQTAEGEAIVPTAASQPSQP